MDKFEQKRTENIRLEINSKLIKLKIIELK